MPTEDPLLNTRDIMKHKNCSMKFSNVHPDEVSKIISDLPNSTAFGTDNIDTYIDKLLREELTPAITHIINLSINSEAFPQTWKVSKVIPLYKQKDDVLNPNSYRPITLVPILSKIMERAVYNQLMKYMTENSLLNPNHHAYRSHHSTTTAMVELIDYWTRALDSNKIAGACLLDMSAAFDCVEHSILLEKMSIYGCSEEVVS